MGNNPELRAENEILKSRLEAIHGAAQFIMDDTVGVYDLPEAIYERVKFILEESSSGEPQPYAGELKLATKRLIDILGGGNGNSDAS